MPWNPYETDINKPINEMSVKELLASAAASDLKTELDREQARRDAAGLPRLRDPAAPRFSAEQIAATAAAIEADKARAAEHAKNPLPEDLKGRNALDMNPRDHYRALQALGIGIPDWSQIEREQRAWEAGHGRG